MGSLPRQTPDTPAQRFANEPAIVAFRRPTDDEQQTDDPISAALQEEAENLPVLLKLPDVKPRRYPPVKKSKLLAHGQTEQCGLRQCV